MRGSVIRFPSRKPRRLKNGAPEECVAASSAAEEALSDGKEPDGVMTTDEIVEAYVAMPSDVQEFISQFLRVMRR
jgi:hypothetical protein